MKGWLACDWLALRAKTHGSNVAVELRDHGQTTQWTYEELDARTNAACARLRGAGVEAGSRVALYADDPREALLALHATLRLRAVLVLLHRRLSGSELEEQLRYTGAGWVVTDTGSPWPERVVALTLADASPLNGTVQAPAVPTPEFGDPSWHILLDEAREARAKETSRPDDRDALMLFTSGTTGRSKCAVLTRGALVASAAASALRIGIEPRDRWLACMPLYHVGGLSILLRSVLYGTTAVVLGRFDVAQTLATLWDARITIVSFVPTMLHRCVAGSDGPAPASLRVTLLGGGPATPALIRRAREMGWHPCATYGLTEVASQAATVSPSDAGADGTVGCPLPGTEIRIDDADDDGVGLIAVRSPGRMRGYLDEQRTAEVIRDGWLLTGDIGRLDAEGRLYVLTRRTDLIVSGGENVYPAQVEATLLEVDGVVECTVFGVPDDEWGQRVAVALVLAPNTSMAEVQRRARERLAGHQWPRAWYEVDTLPRTGSGKVRRDAVRDAVLNGPRRS